MTARLPLLLDKSGGSGAFLPDPLVAALLASLARVSAIIGNDPRQPEAAHRNRRAGVSRTTTVGYQQHL
jgi:hypothetical protein